MFMSAIQCLGTSMNNYSAHHPRGSGSLIQFWGPRRSYPGKAFRRRRADGLSSHTVAGVNFGPLVQQGRAQ